MSKLLPSRLSEEELLALLDAEDEAPVAVAQVFEYNDDIVPFLSFYAITPGHTPVSKKLLYKLYKAYSKNPVDSRNFNIQAGLYLSDHGPEHYNLNTDNFAISKHIYQAEKTKDKTKSLAFQKHFNWFLTERKMDKGNAWVEGFILFFIYKDFCRERRVNPKLGYVNFHKFLKLHFQYKRIKGNRSLWFKVDQNTSLLISEEEANVIRNARKKEGRGKEKSESRSEKTST